MSLHEYQSMKIFEEFGVTVPKNRAVSSLDDVKSHAASFGQEVVIKAQVLAGGRGLGHFKETGFQGGVHIKPVSQAVETASKMLGQTLVTKQTGATGKPCNQLLLVEKVSIDNEKYFAIINDRSSGGPLLIGSKVGGTSIEDIAAANPDAIVKLPVDITLGLAPEDATKFAQTMGFAPNEVEQASKIFQNLYRLFKEKDATMVEINPLAVLKDNRVMVCDGKVSFDDNAAFRQKDVFDQRDYSQEDSKEVEAGKFDLNYIALDGNIACMVNGAGLAMATMDLLAHQGGAAANFLDVGGSAAAEQIEAAIKILNADPSVKVIFVNICGGILRCDMIAEGLVKACQALNVTHPIVLRLVGTNVDAGRKIIEDSKLNCHMIESLNEAGAKAVELARQA